MDVLTTGLKGIGFSESQINNLVPKMNNYIHELELFNSAYDLINTENHDDIVIRHILDSLAAYPYLIKLAETIKSEQVTGNENSTFLDNKEFLIADIGSGGGLPGIPLAAAMSDYNFILVERMSKRCAFLENCAAVLGLTNVKVVNQQAERIPLKSYDLVVFRAFRPLDKKMAKILLRIRKPHGKLAAYKAKMEKITEEMAGIQELVPEYNIEKLNVPFLTDDHERNLVII